MRRLLEGGVYKRVEFKRGNTVSEYDTHSLPLYNLNIAGTYTLKHVQSEEYYRNKQNMTKKNGPKTDTSFAIFQPS